MTMQTNVAWMLGGIFAILIISSILVIVLQRKNPDKDYTELSQRVRSWWVMVFVFTLAIVLNKTISLLFFALISFLALKEYLSLIPTRRADRRVLFWAYLTVPIQYLWVANAWYGMFIIFIPVYVFLFLPTRMMLIGETKDFLRAAGTLHWGVMMTVFSLSHMAFLLMLPAAKNPSAGGAGLVLFLVFLTQFNDVAQYTWGKLFGKRPIVPAVSPKKTWEGFGGGVATSILCALLLAPLLTPLSFLQAAFAGLLISAGGFIGDVIISSVKRDIGVKDSGHLLPGHGGILDRIDSLTYTAPLFFHYIYYLHY